MSDPAIVRPVPAWIRFWAILTFTVALVLLFVLGGFVTSFRAGMADPVWPTEPWYLIVNDEVWTEELTGFLMEHTHRAAGWIVGFLVIVLTVGSWLSEPNRPLRLFGMAVIVGLVVCYGEFHRGMGKAYEARQDGAAWDQLPLPVASGTVTVLVAGLCLAACAMSAWQGTPGRGTRIAAMLTLIGVMIQGLLGGFRVFLDQLLGTTLAAYHGVFGQVVLVLMAVTMVLAAPRRPGDAIPPADRNRLMMLAVVLPALVSVQLIWAVWLRHLGSPVAQRLHILTAFVVTGVAVWLAVRVVSIPAARQRIGFLAYHLVAIVAVQVLLGVESYLVKFAATGPSAQVLPTDRVPKAGDAAIRTAHAVIGAALLAASVVLALRVARKPLRPEEEAERRTRIEPASASPQPEIAKIT